MAVIPDDSGKGRSGETPETVQIADNRPDAVGPGFNLGRIIRAGNCYFVNSAGPLHAHLQAAVIEAFEYAVLRSAHQAQSVSHNFSLLPVVLHPLNDHFLLPGLDRWVYRGREPVVVEIE